MTAWLVSALLALLMVNIRDHIVGPLGDLAGGIDISLLAALVLPALLYPVLLWAFPEPRAVFGPSGARGVPMSDRPVAPILARARRSSAACEPDSGDGCAGLVLQRHLRRWNYPYL